MTLSRDCFAVVIPAYNESSTIFSVVERIKNLQTTVFVVDDGSVDKTGDLASMAGAIVITHKNNMGYEAALETGIKKSIEEKFEYIVTFDADDQMNIDDILSCVSLAKSESLDLVVGVRSYYNRYSEYMLKLFGIVRFGLQDPLCGMKLYRVSVLRNFLPFDSLQLVGMEAAFRIINSGYKFTQFNININKRKGVSRYGSSLKGEFFILKALFKSIKFFGFFSKKI